MDDLGWEYTSEHAQSRGLFIYYLFRWIRFNEAGVDGADLPSIHHQETKPYIES